MSPAAAFSPLYAHAAPLRIGIAGAGVLAACWRGNWPNAATTSLFLTPPQGRNPITPSSRPLVLPLRACSVRWPNSNAPTGPWHNCWRSLALWQQHTHALAADHQQAVYFAQRGIRCWRMAAMAAWPSGCCHAGSVARCMQAVTCWRSRSMPPNSRPWNPPSHAPCKAGCCPMKGNHTIEALLGLAHAAVQCGAVSCWNTAKQRRRTIDDQRFDGVNVRRRRTNAANASQQPDAARNAALPPFMQHLPEPAALPAQAVRGVRGGVHAAAPGVVLNRPVRSL